MRRRDFIKGIAGSAVAWPFAARAQQSASQMRLVAILSSIGANNKPEEALRKRLAELGWREGGNIRYEIRRAESDVNRARVFAAELVAMRPDVIFASNGQMVESILAKTRDIPIVFVAVPHPIGSGFIASFARPGGNVTGFTNFEPSVAGKWIEFLKDIAPDLNRVAVILDGNQPSVEYENAIEVAAPTFAIQLTPAKLRDGASIDAAVATFAREGGGGLIVPSSALSVLNRDRIIALAAQYRLPAMYPYNEFVAAGGLVSYGLDRNAYYRDAALYVDRVLKGEKPADLPVQAPTKFDLTINLKTAKALGLSVPKSMLLVADEVIE